MKNTVLILNEDPIERSFWNQQLGKEFYIMEACDGEQALKMIHQSSIMLSAILINTEMQDMDGMDIVKFLKEKKEYQTLPILIVTANRSFRHKERLLRLGVDEVINRPCDISFLAKIMRRIVDSDSVGNGNSIVNRDKLTGLFSSYLFFSECDKRISEHEPGFYVMSCMDIDNFKVINDQYGLNIGDEVLVHVADCLNQCMADINGLVCRFTADRFAIMFPVKYLDSEQLCKVHNTVKNPKNLDRSINIRIGRYIVNDCSIKANIIYERATIAEESIKGRYDIFTSYYDDSMRMKILKEQQIVSDMKDALENGEFVPYLQPQYNHMTGAIIGAEALVRWFKNGKMISPGDFIPIFEKNGFVFELDKYMWEKICILLNSWKNSGKTLMPISVNISRMDFHSENLCEILCNLLDKYQLPVELLRLEVTESAFADTSNKIIEVVNQLIDKGFTVEIDDFGSGYSSLNTLKDVKVSILKLDMKFLDTQSNSSRGGNIIESVVRMAKWLGMAVIAEGVEERDQADFLRTIGCYYVQGYYYARPMPVSDFENLVVKERKETTLTRLTSLKSLNNSDFWNPKSIETLIFNSYVGGACIFEYHKQATELLRVNERFRSELGKIAEFDADYKYIDLMKIGDEKSHEILHESMIQAIETGNEVNCDLVIKQKADDIYEYLNLTMRVIANTDDRYMFYCVIVNMTKQHQAEQKRIEAEKKEIESARQLQAIMSNINGGVSAIVEDGNHRSYIAFCSERYSELYGLTRDEFLAKRRYLKSLMVKEDYDEAVKKIKQLKKDRKPVAIDYRFRKEDGSLVYLRANASMMDSDVYGKNTVNAVVTDVSEQKILSDNLLDNLPYGVAQYEYDGTKFNTIHINKKYWEMVNRLPEDNANLSILDAVHKDDLLIVRREIESAIRQGRKADCTVRILYGDGDYRKFHIVANVKKGTKGKYVFYTSYEPVNEHKGNYREMLTMALRTVMETQEEVTYMKDRELRYIYCNSTAAKMIDLKDNKDIIGKKDSNFFGKELADEFNRVDRQVLRTGLPVLNYIEKIPTKNGMVRLSKTSKYPIFDSDNNVIGIYGVGRDENDIREKESMLHLLTSTIPGGLAAYSIRKGEIETLFANEVYYKFSGYSKEKFRKITEKDQLALVHEEDKPRVVSMIKGLEKHPGDGTVGECIYRCKSKDGTYRWLSLKCRLAKINEDLCVLNVVQIDITNQKEAEEKLRMAKEEYKLVAKHSGRTIAKYSIADKTVTINNETANRLSLPEVITDVPYGRVKLGKISEDTANAYIEFYEKINNGAKEASVIFRKLLPNGWRFIMAEATTIFNDVNEPISALISYVDDTEQYEKEAIFRRWHQTIENRDSDSFTLYRCNLCDNSSFDSYEGNLIKFTLPNRSDVTFDEYTQLYAEECVYEEDMKTYIGSMKLNTLLSKYYKGERHFSIEYREKQPDNSLKWLKRTVDLVERPDSKGIMAYLMFENIDTKKKTEIDIQTMAITDSLTGVLNRKYFEEQLNRQLGKQKLGTFTALYLIDLDNFKQVNDNFGHNTGDQVLINVGNSIKTVFRDYDLVGRLGGDEFMACIFNVTGEAAIESKAKQLCNAIKQHVNEDIDVNASIGISVSPKDGNSFAELYQNADKALYGVKRKGKNGYAFYHGGENAVSKKSRKQITE